jgi:hypothetical protein
MTKQHTHNPNSTNIERLLFQILGIQQYLVNRVKTTEGAKESRYQQSDQRNH